MAVSEFQDIWSHWHRCLRVCRCSGSRAGPGTLADIGAGGTSRLPDRSPRRPLGREHSSDPRSGHLPWATPCPTSKRTQLTPQVPQHVSFVYRISSPPQAAQTTRLQPASIGTARCSGIARVYPAPEPLPTNLTVCRGLAHSPSSGVGLGHGRVKRCELSCRAVLDESHELWLCPCGPTRPLEWSCSPALIRRTRPLPQPLINSPRVNSELFKPSTRPTPSAP